jgi:hypothetical protein
MLAAIVRSPLALNVAGEEPEHGGLIKIAKPADILVELPTKFTLADNLKSAKALGLTTPQSILARADEVIQ